MAFKQKKCNAKLTDTAKLKYGNKYKGKSFKNFNPEGVSIPIVYNDGADSHINPSGDVNKTVGFFSDIYKKMVDGVESIYAKSISLKAEFLDRVKKEKAYLSIGAGRNDLELSDNDIYEIKDIHHVALIFNNNIPPRNKGCFIESIIDNASINNDIIDNGVVHYIENTELTLNDNDLDEKEEPVNNKAIEDVVINFLNTIVKDDNIEPKTQVDNSLVLLNKLVENSIDIKKFIEYKSDEDFKELNDDKIIKIIKKNSLNLDKPVDKITDNPVDKPKDLSIKSEVDAMSFEKNDKNTKKDVDNNEKIKYNQAIKEKVKLFLEQNNKK